MDANRNGRLRCTKTEGSVHRSELRPRLERSFLGSSPLRVVDALLGRVDVDHSPGDRAGQHLPQRLGRLETVPGSDRHPPSRDLLRTKVAETSITELCDGFREQPAQLLHRLRLRVVLRQILLDKRCEGEGARRAVRAPQALKRPLERLPRVPLRLEAAPLHPARAAPANPIPVSPTRLSAGRLRFHLYDLTQLRHHDHVPSSETQERDRRSARTADLRDLSQGSPVGGLEKVGLVAVPK